MDIELDHLRHLADNNAMFKRDEARVEKSFLPSLY